MIKKELHIVMLEDNALDAELNKIQIEMLDEYDCQVILVQDKKDYLKEITATSKPDLILCDYNLPSYNGMDALKDLNELKLNIPFIFVTGTMHEEIAADAIKAGAWDYVVKDRLFRLPLAIKGVLKLKQEKDISIEADKKIERLIKGIDETTVQVVVLDKNYTVEYVNFNFLKVNGFIHEDIIGQTLPEIFSKHVVFGKETIDKVLEEKGKFKGQVKFTKENGEVYWDHLVATPIFSENNNFEGYTLVADTINKQKELEENLKKSLDELQSVNDELETSKQKAEESDRLKTAFLANLSHEIRTPMNGILGFAELLKDQDLSQQEIGYYVNIIEQSGKRMLNIINDLVNISKIEANQIVIENQYTNINELLEEVCSFFLPQANQKGIKLTCEKDPKIVGVNVYVDKIKLQQVLSNLINNALKFTKKGFIQLKYTIEDSHLLFIIKDSGKGIPMGKEDIIFERFRQADESHLKETEGSGLGLSIAKSFIEKMGGDIWVKSEYGKGSEFYVKLPYVPGTLNKRKL